MSSGADWMLFVHEMRVAARKVFSWAQPGVFREGTIGPLGVSIITGFKLFWGYRILHSCAQGFTSFKVPTYCFGRGGFSPDVLAGAWSGRSRSRKSSLILGFRV